jgi:hypothetical protein
VNVSFEHLGQYYFCLGDGHNRIENVPYVLLHLIVKRFHAAWECLGMLYIAG